MQFGYHVPPPPPPAVVPNKDYKMPLAVVILGIVMVAIGVVVYAWAMSTAVHDITNVNPNDPFGTFEDVGHDIGLLWGSYAIMGVGGLVTLIGFILLILRMI